MSEFLNKRIVITGASSGIGQACAMYFLNNGAKVVLCGRDLDTLKKIGKKFPNQASAINIDLSDDLLIFDLKTTVIEILGGIDIFINCAGVQFDGDVEKTFPQDYDYTIDVNLRAVFILIKSFHIYFTNTTSIVNVSCLAGSRPQNNLTGYCVSKAGLEILTKFAAAEFASTGVRVNAVTACPVDTNSQRYVGVGEGEYNNFKQRVSGNIPLGRMATPDDVAKAIIFLSSSRSSTITGQILKVDGGRSLTTSGWVPWRGMVNMNSRFEPDGVKPMVKFNDLYGKFTGKGGEKVDYPTKEEDIEKLMSESNWATRLSEAHEKITAVYKPIDDNDEYLKGKYANKK
jgi:3-oxoacyl-[acyl-carrier protein] reductase